MLRGGLLTAREAICAGDSDAGILNLRKAMLGLIFAAAIALPAPHIAPPEAPPQILAVRLSSERVQIGDTWSGTIVTTTNVASLEVSSPSFVFNAKRVAYGKFIFTLHWLFIEPLYRRQYTVAFVARNAAGVSTERDIPVDFR
jgi:hypothetical protein